MRSLMIRTYTELSRLHTFEERYKYLRLRSHVGNPTFGFDRYLNQMLYASRWWKDARDEVIIRDNACDLGMDDYEIGGKIIIHHMNPITIEDIKSGDKRVFDPRFLICTTEQTHLAIHYGDESLLPQLPIIRCPGDTAPWLRLHK